MVPWRGYHRYFDLTPSLFRNQSLEKVERPNKSRLPLMFYLTSADARLPWFMSLLDETRDVGYVGAEEVHGWVADFRHTFEFFEECTPEYCAAVVQCQLSSIELEG